MDSYSFLYPILFRLINPIKQLLQTQNQLILIRIYLRVKYFRVLSLYEQCSSSANIAKQLEVNGHSI